jgi:glycosyltransferase involved in cell wall biosynthesis
MAIVRHRNPNIAELSMYKPFLPHFDLTFFFAGSNLREFRQQLDAFGMIDMKTVQYYCVSDLFPSGIIKRGLDYKVGVGSYMVSHLDDVLSHEYINVADPIFGHTHQIARRLRSDQKLIVVRWDNLYGTHNRIWLASRRASRVIQRADVVVCVSQAAVATLRLPYPFTGKVIQVYPGVEMTGVRLKETGEKTGRLFCDTEHPVVLFVARLQWTKGLHSLLVAMHILQEKWHIVADLWVIGSGNSAPFQKIARELDLEHQVTFMGRRTNAEVNAMMAKADIFCFPSLLSPSWMEQFGFALVEAMAHGLPVVAFDSGSIREVCGDDALYASTGNPYSLAEQIAKTIQDRAESRARGERLRQRAKLQFDAEQQGMRMLEAI